VRAIGLGLVTALLASCSQPPPPAASPFDDPNVLAVVGGETITKADFEAAQARRPSPADALLDELIEHRALVQEARAKGYDRDPQTIAAVENLLANRVREEFREAQKWEVTDAEIESRYRAEQKKYTVPAKIRVAMIFVEAPKSFTEEKRAERRGAIEAARTKATESPDQFPALAAEYSYDQTTKFRGGDLGYLIEGIGAEELEPPVLAAAFALQKPGDLSKIIAAAKGCYLLRLTEKSAASVRPLSTVAAQIRADLQREKQKRAEQELKTIALAKHRIESRRTRLPAPPVAKPAATQATPPAVPAAH